MNRITVAIASPGDVQQERDAVPRLFTKWNEDNPELPALHPKMWEFATPELGKHPQHILNASIIAKSDLLVAILHSRLGTPTPTASSGTVEEIREFIEKKGPRRVMLYFCKRPFPVDINVAELTRLNEFKEQMRSQGLFCEYTTLEEFERELSRHLNAKVRQLLNNELPIPEPTFEKVMRSKEDLPLDRRFHDFVEFGTSLDSIASGYLARMNEFAAIDGCTNDKFYRLGAHVYTSAARCLDRVLAFSAADISPANIHVLENISLRLKHLASNIPPPGADFREYWNEGLGVAKQLSIHAAHIKRCKS